MLLLSELLPVTEYVPDFEAANAGGTKLYIGCGQYGLKRNAWYAEAARIMAERLSCEIVAFPGHHASFMNRPAEWAEIIREIAHKANW